MAKCYKCNRSLFMHGKLKLKDVAICHDCAKELGFDPKIEMWSARNYTWDDMKDGVTAYYERIRKMQEEFRRNNPELVKAIHDLSDDTFDDDYDEEDKKQSLDLNVNIHVKGSWHKELNETDGEAEIFDIITKMFPDEPLELIRKSNDYVTVMYGEWDIVRIKFSDRAQWVMFPTIEAKQKRHHVDAPNEIRDYEDFIQESLNHAKKYEN